MASGQMSPRQKMINMMYLVLTALLALNVSAEILQAFESLRGSLALSADNFATANERTAKQIREHVAKEMKLEDDSHEHMLALTDEITRNANEMVNYVEDLTKDLQPLGDWDAETQTIRAKDEKDKNYRFWMGKEDLANGGQGSGKAKELHEELDQYIEWANKLVRKYDSSLVEDPFIRITEMTESGGGHEAEASGKPWEYRTFHDKPIIADLTMLEKFKMDIRQVESELLKAMEKELQPDININKLVGFSAARAEIVPAGTYFEARIFPTLASSNIKPEFIGNGITVDPENPSIATIKIPASANVIPSGQSDGVQRWQAMIKVPTRKGYTELPVSGEFTVRRPEVVVRSAAVQNLYHLCGNEVIVDVPALEDQYNPDFSASRGGRILKDAANKKKITIVPTDRKYVLSVASNTNGQRIKIDDVKYNVIKPPKPEIQLFANNRPYDGMGAVSKRGKVKIRLKADDDFKAFLPRDARYVVKTVKLLYQSGIQTAKLVKSYSLSGTQIMSGLEIPLYQGKIRNATPGDKAYIEIERVVRMNYEGREVEVPLPMTERLLRVNLR